MATSVNLNTVAGVLGPNTATSTPWVLIGEHECLEHLAQLLTLAQNLLPRGLFHLITSFVIWAARVYLVFLTIQIIEKEFAPSLLASDKIVSGQVTYFVYLLLLNKIFFLHQFVLLLRRKFISHCWFLRWLLLLQWIIYFKTGCFHYALHTHWTNLLCF
jgi:hypothetical protein